MARDPARSLLLHAEAFGSRYEDWRHVPPSGFQQRLIDARHFAAGAEAGKPLAVACWQAGLVEETLSAVGSCRSIPAPPRVGRAIAKRS
ncbi:hypothetical protein [Paracoccus cavernae]